MEEGVVATRSLAGGEKIETLPQDPKTLHDDPPQSRRDVHPSVAALPSPAGSDRRGILMPSGPRNQPRGSLAWSALEARVHPACGAPAVTAIRSTALPIG